METDKTINIKLLIEKAKDISLLYAEDEKYLRDKTAAFLKKIFINVDVAEDGKIALDKYMDNKYDIVITDIEMPNMGGLELISNIRKINKKQEIIINSAYRETEFNEQAAKYNVTNYIRKPIDLYEIVRILDDYIDKVNLPSPKENE